MNSKEQKNPDEQVSQENEIAQEQQIEAVSKVENIEDPLNAHVEIIPEAENILDPRDAYITELKEELIQVQQHERDSLLRFQAEIENIRRRSKLDIEKAHKLALERFTGELLPVIDNLERALDISDKSNNNQPSIIEGIKLTLQSLLDAVRKFGLTVIEDTNIPFNPEIHQAMTMLESDKHEPNYVMRIIQKGYTLNDRLIRPAMVSVSKAKGC